MTHIPAVDSLEQAKPKPSYAPIYAAALYPQLSELARKHGYALAVHGSLQRDFDLIAIPWVESPSDPQNFVDAITAGFAAKEVGGPPSDKPHGRRTWSLSIGFGTCAIDLSFMPALTRPPGGSERLRELAAKWRARAIVRGDYAGATEECADELEASLASPQGAEQRQGKWYLGSMNDGLFIINRPPSPAGTDVGPWMNPNGPTLVLNVTDLPDEKAQAIIDAHNATPHPEPAATQGDAVRVALQQLTKAGVAFRHEAVWDDDATTEAEFNAVATPFDAALDAAQTALSSPAGVQAAHVSDRGITEMAEVLEMLSRDPRPLTESDRQFIGIAANELKRLAQPGGAAHGGEVSGG